MQTYSIREICEKTFNKLGLDYNKYTAINSVYFRPLELNYLKGDSTKARSILKWKPEYNIDMIIDEMIAHWQDVYYEKALTGK
jgi:GDPmannose 4,6-dehydratase